MDNTDTAIDGDNKLRIRRYESDAVGALIADWISHNSFCAKSEARTDNRSGTGARFSKDPKSFRTRKTTTKILWTWWDVGSFEKRASGQIRINVPGLFRSSWILSLVPISPVNYLLEPSQLSAPGSPHDVCYAGWRVFLYELIEIFTKEIGVKRDLSNRVSPVNRAHMKRP